MVHGELLILREWVESKGEVHEIPSIPTDPAVGMWSATPGPPEILTPCAPTTPTKDDAGRGKWLNAAAIIAGRDPDYPNTIFNITLMFTCVSPMYVAVQTETCMHVQLLLLYYYNKCYDQVKL